MIDSEHWILDAQEALVPLEKWQKTVNVMAKIFKAPSGFIVQRGPGGYQVVISSEQETNPYPAGGVIEEDTNIFCKKVVEDNAPLYVKNAVDERCWDTNPEVTEDGFRSYLGLPVSWPNGVPFGTICVMDYEATDYQKEYMDLMSELRDLIEADLEILHQYNLITNMAMTDELTGLYNRRGFNSVAGQYMALAKRSKLRLGLMFMDMDGLKHINDEQGHLAGDKALKSLAASIKEVVREDDVPARLSGDEFAMLVSADSQEKLDQLADRIISKLVSQDLHVSIGSVLIDDADKDLGHWLECADKRMYQQKHAE